jgi:hypothetical protein
VTLHPIGKPTVQQDTQDVVVSLLERMLVQARQGEIASVLFLAQNPANEWLEDYAGEATITEFVGRIEIAKHELIQQYLKRV